MILSVSLYGYKNFLSPLNGMIQKNKEPHTQEVKALYIKEFAIEPFILSFIQLFSHWPFRTYNDPLRIVFQPALGRFKSQPSPVPSHT